MKVHVFENGQDLAHEVARRLALKLESQGNVGFATGRTMDPVYEALLQKPPRQIQARAWMLDEYLGLSQQDERSYAAYLALRVFKPLSYPASLINLPQLNKLTPVEAAQEYESRLKDNGGAGMQLLGIGHNGHVGLNEPGSEKQSRTRVVKIAERTRVANQDFFASLNEVPTEALTLGLGTLNEAKELWLLATGNGKAEIIQKLIEGPVTTEVPATLLRDHAGLEIFLDKAAASLLKQPVS